MVHVDQGDAADGGTRQCLGGPGTHAADAEHTDVRLPEPCQCLLAVQAPDAAETACKVRAVGGGAAGFVRDCMRLTYARQAKYRNNGCVCGHCVCHCSAYNHLMELIDTHCHLDVSDFDADRQAVLQRAHGARGRGIVVPGIHAAGWAGLWQLCPAKPDCTRRSACTRCFWNSISRQT